MKTSAFRALALAIACLFGLNVAHADTVQDDSATAIAGNCDCCSSGGWVAGFEATFFRHHDDDLYDITSGGDVFGFEFAPRVTLGYVNCDGIGLRGRWWHYDHAAIDLAGVAYDVSAQNIDVEVFQDIQLNCLTTLEWSAGTRFNQYKLTVPAFAESFSAPGVVIGGKLSLQLPIGGSLYASVRQSWLMSDLNFDGGVAIQHDVTRTISEGAIGYAFTTCLANGSVLTLNGGVELQQWNGYGSTNGHDAGFGGFVVGAGLNY